LGNLYEKFKKKENLHFDNVQGIHTISKYYERTDCGLDLDPSTLMQANKRCCRQSDAHLDVGNEQTYPRGDLAGARLLQYKSIYALISNSKGITQETRDFWSHVWKFGPKFQQPTFQHHLFAQCQPPWLDSREDEQKQDARKKLNIKPY
jgi:hypothetical protein